MAFSRAAFLGRRLASLAVVVASAAASTAVLFPAGAAGSAIYNSSESGLPNPAYVRFVCGVVCNNDFTIPVGQFRARPGKAGVFWAGPSPTNWGIGQSACENEYDDDNNRLTEHGWSELHNPAGGNNFSWHIFDDSGGNTANPTVSLVTGGGVAFYCG